MANVSTIFEITITPKAKRDLIHLSPYEKMAVQEALEDIKTNATTAASERQVMSKRSRYWIFRQRLTCGFLIYNVLMAGSDLTNKVVITMLSGFAAHGKKTKTANK
ncbi:MAG: type II toxin-antitoxin system RelE family toxin [Vampirovibrionales bacterium]